MKVAKIELNSPAEVKDEFSDVIFFQGCTRKCVYCFNPELQTKGTFDQEMDVKTIAQYIYNSFSSVVVLTGGEPLDQDYSELINLLAWVKATGKKIIVETSKYDKTIFNTANHILYCIKTWDIDERTLIDIAERKDVTKIVVTDHKDFSFDGYMKALEYLEGTLYYRPANDRLLSKQWANLYKLAKRQQVQLKRWEKTRLTKKNSTK